MTSANRAADELNTLRELVSTLQNALEETKKENFLLRQKINALCTNLMTEAKSIIGVFAAGASLIASLYAIAIARQRLKKITDQNPFALRSQPSRFRRRPSRPASRSSRLKKLRRASVLSVSLWLIPLLAFTGCSHVATKRAQADNALTKSNEQLTEQSRALTTGIVDSLAVASENSVLSPQSSALNLARRFAIADQEIEGLPLQRIPATAALTGNPKAAADIEARFTEINGLRAHNSQLAQALRERDAALMELGEKYEAEKNKTLWRRIKTALIGTFGISGLIALCVFCPAVIPILTRALAWIVSKIPQLAGALGVVGKDAFDAVVKGVGLARSEFKNHQLPLSPSATDPTTNTALEILDANLSTQTDADHRALINQRRAALNV